MNQSSIWMCSSHWTVMFFIVIYMRFCPVHPAEPRAFQALPTLKYIHMYVYVYYARRTIKQCTHCNRSAVPGNHNPCIHRYLISMPKPFAPAPSFLKRLVKPQSQSRVRRHLRFVSEKNSQPLVRTFKTRRLSFVSFLKEHSNQSIA